MWCCVRASLARDYLVLPVMAADEQPVVSVQGKVPAVCPFSAAQAGQVSNSTFGTALSSRYVFAISQLIDPTRAQLSPVSITIPSKGDFNQPRAVTIKTGNGGIQTGSSAGGFSYRIDYSVNGLWGSSSKAFERLVLRDNPPLRPWLEPLQERSKSKSSSRLVKRTLFPSSPAPTPITLS